MQKNWEVDFELVPPKMQVIVKIVSRLPYGGITVEAIYSMEQYNTQFPKRELGGLDKVRYFE